MSKYIPHLERRDLLCNRRGGGLATALLARSSERPGSPRGVLQEVLDLSLVVGLDQLQTPLGVLVARVQVVETLVSCAPPGQLAVAARASSAGSRPSERAPSGRCSTLWDKLLASLRDAPQPEDPSPTAVRQCSVEFE